MRYCKKAKINWVSRYWTWLGMAKYRKMISKIAPQKNYSLSIFIWGNFNRCPWTLMHIPYTSIDNTVLLYFTYTFSSWYVGFCIDSIYIYIHHILRFDWYSSTPLKVAEIWRVQSPGMDQKCPLKAWQFWYRLCMARLIWCSCALVLRFLVCAPIRDKFLCIHIFKYTYMYNLQYF